jgi:hypothetical protein
MYKNNYYLEPLNSTANEQFFKELGETNFLTLEDEKGRERKVYRCDLDFIKRLYKDKTANTGLEFQIFKKGTANRLLHNIDNEIKKQLKFKKTGVRVNTIKITIEDCKKEAKPEKSLRAQKKPRTMKTIKVH